MIRRVLLTALVLVAAAMADLGAAAPPTIVAPPPGSGPVARAHTRTWRHRRSTVRVTRRSPEVMREDAARIKRGDLFSTWSNAAAN
ncbi:MAG: hypothetical protein ACKOC8_01665 [Pirellulales bacterium]